MKTILITGATSGIGQALTLHAAAKGHQVIACGRNAKALEQLAKTDNVTTCQFDVSDRQATITAINALDHSYIDIAVLNAGTCEYVDIDNFDSAMFRRVFEANFFGVVYCVEALLPKLTRGCQIAVVDSMARLLPFSRTQAYGASKAAVHYFAKSLEVDLATRGIRVQTVSPGFVETPLTDKNDFKMPARISAERAAEDMLNGLLSKHSSIYFPTLFGWMLRLLNQLPAKLQSHISRALRKQQ
ncbi:SDR family NAD(P)-dependent oxidoreductase [Alteromonas aestuariivivens]|uniref:SDR family NAD(P)-dependent oxidoreductase n=1 Tax=Alteromonas aestuariivivens TaxID=1938339 RepID=A0A3D8MF49_9ALTE|nr:SDR family NAD(P)-dependent oxidoreductase [Alteromonas aestuariivivens]RDV29393.1 SDR family NAD(P)-dependent oxidoreductase [Alteromonas aestuariivivens]